MRPDVGTQPQSRKKKPPATYRYDSSLSPALNWDGQNLTREFGEWLLGLIQRAAALPAPHAFERPQEFKTSDGAVLASVTTLHEAVELHAVPAKAAFEIRCPRVEGYRQAIRSRLALDWSAVPTITLDPMRIPPEVEVKAALTSPATTPPSPAARRPPRCCSRSSRRSSSASCGRTCGLCRRRTSWTWPCHPTTAGWSKPSPAPSSRTPREARNPSFPGTRPGAGRARRPRWTSGRAATSGKSSTAI